MLEFNVPKLPYEACIILRYLCSEMGVLASGTRIVAISVAILYLYRFISMLRRIVLQRTQFQNDRTQGFSLLQLLNPTNKRI